MATMMRIFSIEDDFGTPIHFEKDGVFLVNPNTIQVEDKILDKSRIWNNTLHLVVQVNPKLITIPDDVQEAIRNVYSWLPGVNVEVPNKEVNYELEQTTKNIKEEYYKTISKWMKETYIDLPIQLIECLKLGVSLQASTVGGTQIDPRAGTPYSINPYLERYELAIKKAIDKGFILRRGIQKRKNHMKGFMV